MSFFKKVLKIFRGSFRQAIKDGMLIEKGVTVMSGVNFGSEPYLIKLHKYSRISSNVIFITHDGGTWAFRNTNKEFKDVKKFGTIEIGEYSFIGAGSIIMPGVHIGNNCVIGAGSIVTKDVPDNYVVCGVPARILCTTNEYAVKCKDSMPNDFNLEKYNKSKKEYLIETYWKRKE